MTNNDRSNNQGNVSNKQTTPDSSQKGAQVAPGKTDTTEKTSQPARTNNNDRDSSDNATKSAPGSNASKGKTDE
ncbi:MAG: hypothetical protein EON60_09600 [Alphaproteobacteria bacterium]|nr:MAG: hypothetical protein EON60_09600 [Alphaproteobacteria bacterium]